VKLATRPALALLLALPAAAPAEKPHGSHEHDHGDDATIHHRFEDAERWAERFEAADRDEWQLPGEVISRVVDRPDLVVADIGSATGYFTVRFADAVPEGMVIGSDVEPDMVRYLNDRARAEGRNNLVSVLAAPGDPHLPRPADVVFLCNTIHHIDGRVDYFRRLLDQTTEDARLVVVDYKPESSMGPPHKLDSAQVVDELGRAGWTLVASHDALPEQWFLVLGRSEP
jgi:SAM-dependent methyltransferase